MTDLEGTNLNDLVQTVIQARRFLTPSQIESIRTALGPSTRKSFGADFDLLDEVQQQITAVRALRASAVTPDGRLASSAKDAKEALSASISLLKLLTDLQSEIVNIARLRAVEESTAAALKDVDESLHERFMQELERRLEHQL